MDATEIPLKEPAVSVAAGDTEQVERALIDASTRVPVLMFYASAIAFDPDPLRAPGFSNTIGISKSSTGGLTFGNPVFIPAGGVVIRASRTRSL